MITGKHQQAGDYYRVCVIELRRDANKINTAVKCQFFKTAKKAGKVAGQWASDLPSPIACHYISIQYIEAKS